MNTLQRSNVSFRRQGSSGHIWDDRLFGVLEPRAGNKSATDKGEAENLQRYDRSKEDKRFLFHSTEIAYNSDSPASSSNSTKRQNKVRSCSCCSLFGRCIGSSPTA
ncbi:hypothetical protein F2P56_000324 [Juglans regia]|uniref:MAPK kinase substrate protein At1g80180-like n=2 Tax=Juglans regia TaxID=51240 RepID=A0A833YAK7_JUGRE|nr:uncharacterized protein At1g15400-like [Juglans regia]KAF5479512.1 hypothetical protein F2P56_000324 [Juglans regia]